jgi:hypothetical protein
MKAKITQVTQFGCTKYGYEATLHTSQATDFFFDALIQEGYEIDFPEDSDETGYDECYSIFAESGATKKEFESDLRKAIKNAIKGA